MAITESGSPVLATETSDDNIVQSYTAASGTTILVSVLNSAQSVSSITYNGGTWEELHESGLILGICRESVWMSVDSADGVAHDMTITFSAAIGGELAHAVITAWAGGVTTSIAAAHRTVYTDNTDVGDMNITVSDAVSGDMIVHGLSNWGTAPVAVETVVSQTDSILAGAYDHLLQRKAATGGDAMTITGGQFGAAWAFALIPAAAGPTITAVAGAVALTGVASVFRVGATTWLRYAK